MSSVEALTARPAAVRCFRFEIAKAEARVRRLRRDVKRPASGSENSPDAGIEIEDGFAFAITE